MNSQAAEHSEKNGAATQIAGVVIALAVMGILLVPLYSPIAKALWAIIGL
jgi:hypothetical protein